MGQPDSRDDGRTENVEGYTSDTQTPPQDDLGEWQSNQPMSQNSGNGDDNPLSHNDDPAMSTDVASDNLKLEDNPAAVWSRVREINEYLELMIDQTDRLKSDFNHYDLMGQALKRLEEFDNRISTLTASIYKRTEVEDEKNRVRVKELEDQLQKEREEFTDYRSGIKGSEVETFIRSLFPVYDRWMDVIKRIPPGYPIPRTASKDALGNLEAAFMSQGVETYQTPLGTNRDRKLHDAVDETIPTDDLDKDGTIAIRYKKGFKTGDESSGRILRKELIALYKYNKDGATPNDTEYRS